MKNLKRFVLATTAAASFFAFFAVTGCKKSNDSGSNNPATAISATLSANSFSPVFTETVYFPTWKYIGVVGVTVTNGDSVALEVDIPDTAHVNQPIDVTLNPDAGLYFYNANDIDYSADINGGVGTVTVTSWDSVAHKISGTFTGIMVDPYSDSIKVSNGKFSSTYTVSPD